MMRPLFFDWPEVRQVWEHPYQFMCGDSLLVSPVVEEGATVWSTYLPGSDWVDVWNGEPVVGGGLDQSDVTSRDAVPVFCRAESWVSLGQLFTAN